MRGNRKVRRWLMVLVPTLTFPLAAWANCTTHTITGSGELIFCSTCCVHGKCDTTCNGNVTILKAPLDPYKRHTPPKSERAIKGRIYDLPPLTVKCSWWGDKLLCLRSSSRPVWDAESLAPH